jgi:hypothetical protein
MQVAIAPTLGNAIVVLLEVPDDVAGERFERRRLAQIGEGVD